MTFKQKPMTATLEMRKSQKIREAVKNAGCFSNSATREADQQLAELDLPHFKAEAWKYTRVGYLAATKWSANPTSEIYDISHWKADPEEANTLVFVNGYYRADLSSLHEMPAGVIVTDLKTASEYHPELLEAQYGKHTVNTEVFTALNAAQPFGGLFLYIPDHVVVERTVQMLHLVTHEDTIAQPHHLIRVGENAQVKLVGTFGSINSCNAFVNSVMQISVGKAAHVQYDKLQAEDEGISHICTEYVHQDAQSTFKINTITLNGKMIRNSLHISVNGKHCETYLNGLYVGKGRQHIDNHTQVDHRVPDCYSEENYKGLMDEASSAVFNGKVFVRQDAQKTNAFQNNGNILLSRDARVNSKPELEIYADDVKCSHGSTTGRLNEEALFYLRARGLGKHSARRLLIAAFASDVLESIDNKSVRAMVNRYLQDRHNWSFD